MNLWMKQNVSTVAAVAALCAGASAAELNMSVTSNGSDSATVTSCGATVSYEATGVLSDTLNEGLAGFLLELTLTGGSLEPARVPGTEPMVNFTRPNGVTGSSGFGGRVVGDRLFDVGGAQNVLKNTPDRAPFPIGSVITGVAHAEAVLVTGSFTAPTEPGTYTLTVSKLSASVIVEGEDGSGAFWATEPAGVGTVTDLTIEVLPLDPPATARNSGPVCEGASVMLSGGPDGMLNYHWAGPGGFTSFQQDPTITLALAGTYTLTVTDSNDCTDTAATYVYTEPEPEAIGESPRFMAVTPADCLEDVALYVVGASTDPDVSCVRAFVQADGTLGEDPVFQSAAEWGTVDVADAEIVPGATYEVFGVRSATGCPDLTAAVPAMVTQPAWGDLYNDGQVNGRDLGLFIDAYVGSEPSWMGDLCPEIPDGLVNGDDVLCWIDSFYGQAYPYAPCDDDGGLAGDRSKGTPVASGGLAAARLKLSVAAAQVSPGRTLAVDVLVSGATDLRMYEVAIDAVGGDRGELVFDDVFVDENREDYVFTGDSSLCLADPHGQRATSALWQGGQDTGAGWRYLATFVFVPSRDARGEFKLVLRKGSRTLLRDSRRRPIAISSYSPATIHVGYADLKRARRAPRSSRTP